MENVLISLASILIGAGATILVARYYYRRSVEKELTPFLQFKSNVLDHIDDEVRSDLDIEYKGVRVERLQQVQFLIANTGERAVKDPIKPLSLHIDGEIEVMDANLIHVHPDGRKVELVLHKNDNRIDFDFQLLNKDDFFVAKFLINGAPDQSDYKFYITAEDFPPTLNIRRLDYGQIARDTTDKNLEGKLEFGPLIFGLVFLFLSACVGFLAYSSEQSAIPQVESEFWSWLNEIPFALIASVAGFFFAVILGIIGAIGVIIGGIALGGTSEFEFPKRKKFVLPKEIASAEIGPEYFLELREHRAAVKHMRKDPGSN